MKNNFLKVSYLLNQNGVGFLELYFKSDMCADDFIDKGKKEDIDLTISLSDGKEFLGSLKLKNLWFETGTGYSLNPKIDQGPYLDLLYYIPSKEIGHNKALSVHLCFMTGELSDSGYRGKCYISEDGG